jgi:hypothetical protein
MLSKGSLKDTFSLQKVFSKEPRARILTGQEVTSTSKRLDQERVGKELGPTNKSINDYPRCRSSDK